MKHLAALCRASGKTAPPAETLSAAVGVLWFLSMDEGAARAIAKSGAMPSLMSHLSSKSPAVRFNAAGCLRCLSFDDDILNAMIDPNYVIDADENERGGGGGGRGGEEGGGEAEEDDRESGESGAGKGKKEKKRGGEKNGKGKGGGGGGAKGIKNPADLPHLKVCNDAFERLPTDPSNGKPVPTAGWVKKIRTYKKPGFAAPPSRQRSRRGGGGGEGGERGARESRGGGGLGGTARPVATPPNTVGMSHLSMPRFGLGGEADGEAAGGAGGRR